MKKNILLNTLSALLLTFFFALSAGAQTPPTYSTLKLSYDVDALDIWEIPTPRDPEDVAAKIEAFKARCHADVLAIYQDRIQANGLNLNDFDIQMSTQRNFYRGYGESYACRMTAKIKRTDYYYFKTTQTKSYVDTETRTAFDQCKEFRDGLDARANELALFDRIIQIEWGIRRGTPVQLGCFVIYSTVIKK